MSRMGSYIKADLCVFIFTIWIRPGTCSQDYCTKESCGDPVFLGNFHIPTTPVPRISWQDEKAKERLQKGLPVILTDTNIFKSEVTWNLDNLEKYLGVSKWNWQVFRGDSRRFLYFGNNINYANYKWAPAYNSSYMIFNKFVKQFREIRKAANSTRLYLQSGLYENSEGNAKYSLNTSVREYITKTTQSNGRGGTPWFYVGMPDVYTPMHFDYSDHVVAQIYGHKRWVLVGPEHYGNLYPYPISSPLDRNSRVHMEDPDYTQFPKFKNVQGLEAILKPGDVLYVPSMWWHLVESEHNSETVSLSIDQSSRDVSFFDTFHLEQVQRFVNKKDASAVYLGKKAYLDTYRIATEIYKRKKDEPFFFERPDSPSRQVHVRRAVEQMIAESVGNYRNVGPILKELYEGRFDGLEYNEE